MQRNLRLDPAVVALPAAQLAALALSGATEQRAPAAEPDDLGLGVVSFFRGAFAAQQTAFATSSSLGTLPITLRRRGIEVGGRRGDAEARRGQELARLDELEARWKDEKGLVDRILELRAKLRADGERVDRPAVAVALLIAEFARARVALQGWLSASQAGPQSSSLLNR